jgi:SAM-dependent methyltransferase
MRAKATTSNQATIAGQSDKDLEDKQLASLCRYLRCVMPPSVDAQPLPASLAPSGATNALDRDDARLLNGDRPLSPSQAQAYVAFHRERNAQNTARSVLEGIHVLPGPIANPDHVIVSREFSPARTDAFVFFAWAAQRIATRFAVGADPLTRMGTRPLTILDLGCGSGFLAPILAHAGLCGRYIGLDIKRHAKWKDGHCPESSELRRELIVADIATFNPRELPQLDVIVSCTSLEHIEDDAGAVTKLASRLAPWGVQAHAVPGELSLPLYGPHGWRQYSPACVHALVPGAEIYRYGGANALRVHTSCITQRLARGKPDARLAHPLMYERAVTKARALDARGARGTQAVMYGAWLAR